MKKKIILIIVFIIAIILLSILFKDKANTKTSFEVIEERIVNNKLKVLEKILKLSDKEDVYSKELDEKGYRYKVNSDMIEVYIMDPIKINGMLGNINKNTGEAEICNNDGINKECILFQDNIIITNWRNDETKNLIIEINSSKERDHYNE
jgi:uncharacterized protein YxeA